MQPDTDPRMDATCAAILAGLHRLQQKRGGQVEYAWSEWDEPTYCYHQGFVLRWSHELELGLVGITADLSIQRASHSACRFEARDLAWSAPACLIRSRDPVEHDREPWTSVGTLRRPMFAYCADARFVAALQRGGLQSMLEDLHSIAEPWISVGADRLEIGVGNTVHPEALDSLTELGTRMVALVKGAG